MESAGVVGGRGRAWVRSRLVLCKSRSASFLLVGAGLLMQSMLKIRTASPGFNTRGGAGHRHRPGPPPATLPRAHRPFRTRSSSASARSPAWSPPPSQRMTRLATFSSASAPIVVDGYTPPLEESRPWSITKSATTTSSHGHPLVSGREFTRADDERAALIAVVNEPWPSRYWQGRSPLANACNSRDAGDASRRHRQRLQVFERPQKPTPFFLCAGAAKFPACRRSEHPHPARSANHGHRHPPAKCTRSTPILPPTKSSPCRSSSTAPLRRKWSPSRWLVIPRRTRAGSAAIGLYGVMSYAVCRARANSAAHGLGAGAPNLLRLVLSAGLAPHRGRRPARPPALRCS